MIDVAIISFSQTAFKSALRLSAGVVLTTFVPVLAMAETAAAQQQPPGWVQMVPLVAMVGIFYFLILRPQQKREKQRQGFISALKRGDEVVLSSGIMGRVEGLTDQVITLEIADGVRVKVLRSSIASSVQALTQNATAAAGGKA
jgi:preprotein translocase subunit YajC